MDVGVSLARTRAHRDPVADRRQVRAPGGGVKQTPGAGGGELAVGREQGVGVLVFEDNARGHQAGGGKRREGLRAAVVPAEVGKSHGGNKAESDGIVDGSATVTRLTAWLSGKVDSHGVDGVVNGVGNTLHDASFGFRRAHTGLAQNYALAMVLGVVALVGVYLVVR